MSIIVFSRGSGTLLLARESLLTNFALAGSKIPIETPQIIDIQGIHCEDWVNSQMRHHHLNNSISLIYDVVFFRSWNKPPS